VYSTRSASDKVYQLLARDRWFSPGTPASPTTKTSRYDIAEILLKVALKHPKKSKIKLIIIKSKLILPQAWLTLANFDYPVQALLTLNLISTTFLFQ
jgi:hypothetical protein